MEDKIRKILGPLTEDETFELAKATFENLSVELQAKLFKWMEKQLND